MKKAIISAAAILLALACTQCSNMKTRIQYPETRQDDTVVDDYFGVKVADPYRWLEDDNSAETAAWVAAQNEVTHEYLSKIPYRQAVRDRLAELWNYPKEELPFRAGDYYIFSRNDGLQNQNVLYRQNILDGTPPEVLLDPNKLSADGTVALSGGLSFCNSCKKMAYSLSKAGSDWAEIHVMNVATGQDYPDVIRWVKFRPVSWFHNEFYYSGYDEPDPKNMLSAQTSHQKIYRHVMGTDQSQDQLIYEDPAHPLRYFTPTVSEDGRYLFIDVSEGTSGSQIIFRALYKSGSQFETLLPGFENDYEIVDCSNDKLLIYTNMDALNYRLVEIDLKNPKAAPVDVIAENPESLLQSVQSVGGYLMAIKLEKASSAIYQYDMQGALVRRVDTPALVTAAGFYGKSDTPETFYSLSTYTSPKDIYRYDLVSGVSDKFSTPKLAYDPELYTAQQVFYPSKDGTEVSMFIVHRKDMKREGRNPLLLYGYGGFNHTMTPVFSPSVIMFLEQGGVYAVANLRGGGEYGEKWHRAGMLEQKQNVYDDFIAAAEWLIENKYTSSKHLAIHGGSNGGLLVGACMEQRPELFAAAIPAVGVMDMLRYHKFTVGWGWAVEYGSSDNEDQFRYIYAYSPLHNLHKGTCYPATLITTADHDDRVVPAHSFKFAAALQAAQGCNNPTLIRIDTNAGHGAGKPTSKRLDEAADLYSFIFYNTGAKVYFAAPAAQ